MAPTVCRLPPTAGAHQHKTRCQSTQGSLGSGSRGRHMSEFIAAVVVRAQNGLHNAVYNLRHKEEGQGFVEYLSLVALIALGLFAALIIFKSELATIFSKITNKIEVNL